MPSTREMVQAFLTEQGGAFCGDCLATQLGLRSARVTMAMLGIRREPQFEAREGVCSQCGRQRLVVRRFKACGHESGG